MINIQKVRPENNLFFFSEVEHVLIPQVSVHTRRCSHNFLIKCLGQTAEEFSRLVSKVVFVIIYLGIHKNKSKDAFIYLG